MTCLIGWHSLSLIIDTKKGVFSHHKNEFLTIFKAGKDATEVIQILRKSQARIFPANFPGKGFAHLRAMSIRIIVAGG
jgi:hypothetical protein